MWILVDIARKGWYNFSQKENETIQFCEGTFPRLPAVVIRPGWRSEYCNKRKGDLNMKKLVGTLLALVMVLSLTAAIA